MDRIYDERLLRKTRFKKTWLLVEGGQLDMIKLKLI